jgi:predicted dehydrogenase
VSEALDRRRVGIAMNGVTGRMGTHQHLLRSILAIRAQGGIRIRDGETIVPEPVLVGRSPVKLRELAEQAQVDRWTTDVEEALADAEVSVYFDAQTTDRRFEAVARAIELGKHVYCEKPIATSTRSVASRTRRSRTASSSSWMMSRTTT